MDSLAANIEQLNSKLMLAARDPEVGLGLLHELSADRTVVARITTATEVGIRTAVRCGVPLIVFTDIADQLAQSAWRQRRIAENVLVSQPLRDLTTFALQVVQRLAIQDNTLASMLFGLSAGTVEAIAELGITELECAAPYGEPLIRLRKGDQPLIWDRLLIGNVSGKAWAYRVSHDTALLSLGAE